MSQTCQPSERGFNRRIPDPRLSAGDLWPKFFRETDEIEAQPASGPRLMSPSNNSLETVSQGLDKIDKTRSSFDCIFHKRDSVHHEVGALTIESPSVMWIHEHG